MVTMTLGEFRQLTKDMADDARMTIRIDSNGAWVHPCAGYSVNGYDFDYENNPFNVPTGITLNHIATRNDKEI